jgi:hypothetical protein
LLDFITLLIAHVLLADLLGSAMPPFETWAPVASTVLPLAAGVIGLVAGGWKGYRTGFRWRWAVECVLIVVGAAAGGWIGYSLTGTWVLAEPGAVIGAVLIYAPFAGMFPGREKK